MTIHFHLDSFYETKYFSKKISSGKCSLNKLLNLNWGNLGPLVLHVLLQQFCFYEKTKIFRKNFRVDYYLQQKYCTSQRNLISPTWAQSLAKFNPKVQDFKRGLDLNIVSKGNLKQFNFSMGFQMLKI